jgi:hypothetical protein
MAGSGQLVAGDGITIMRGHRLILAIICLLLAAGRGETADRWRCVTSAHFQLFTDADEHPAEELIRVMEQFLEGATKSLQIDVRPLTPIRAVLFRNDWDYQRVAAEVGKNTELRAAAYATPFYYSPGIVLTLSRYLPDQLAPSDLHNVQHELFHLLMGEATFRQPWWFKEGLAEYYSSYRVQAGAGIIGLAPPEDKEHRLFGLSVTGVQLLADGQTETRVRGLYAAYWWFAHYSLRGPHREYQRKYFDLCARMVAGAPATEETFRQAYGIDYAVLRQGLDEYIRTGTYDLTQVKLSPEAMQPAMAWRQVNDLERDCLLTTFRGVAHPGSDAGAKLLELAAKNPKSALPYVGLACLAQREGKREQLRDALCKAVSLGVTDARVPAYAAKVTLDLALKGAPTNGPLPEELTIRARELCTRALALDSHCALALESLERAEEARSRARVPVSPPSGS